MKHFFTAFLLILLTTVTAKADIVFGVIPLEDKAIMQEKFTALTEYLSSHLGEPVTLKIGSNYDEIETGLGNGTIHIAYVGPSGAVKVNKSNPAVLPLVKVVKSGSPFYKSYVIAKKDSPLTSPALLISKEKSSLLAIKGPRPPILFQNTSLPKMVLSLPA